MERVEKLKETMLVPKRELSLQTDILKSVKKDGGWGIKMTSRFLIGVPDLLVALWPFVPVLIEVKDLGEVTENFSLQLNVTPKQRHTLGQFDGIYDSNITEYSPNRHVSLLMVGFKMGQERRLVALPWRAERLTAAYVSTLGDLGRRGTGGYYAIKPFFERMGICHIKPM